MCLRLRPLPCSPDQCWWSSFLLIPFFSLYFSGIPVQQHPEVRAAVRELLPWYGTERSIDAAVLAEPSFKQRAQASSERTPTVRSSQLASRGIFRFRAERQNGQPDSKRFSDFALPAPLTPKRIRIMRLR